MVLITFIGTEPAPFMSLSTSIWPNLIELNILKPDITAPRLNILAAWSEASSPLKVPLDHRRVKYTIKSGTSMSCPHVAAVAAILKAIHPNWSSAAIRSALTTTAKLNNNMGTPITDSDGNIANPFQFGAGHIQPSKAADPGVVYNASYDDYLLFLCRNSSNLLVPSFKCPNVMPSPSNLNYPSLVITKLKGCTTVTRTVTNAGSKSSYTPPGYSIEISPSKLHFSAEGEKQSFNIAIVVESSTRKNEFEFGWYCWSDGIHEVRSPIALSPE